MKLGFNYNNFAKEIIKHSKVKLFLVNNNDQLAKYVKKIYMEKNCDWNGCWIYF